MIANVILVPRYRDVPAAIEWLFGMCGFQKHLIVPHLDGTVAHAQLSFGGGMLMLRSALRDETEFRCLIE